MYWMRIVLQCIVVPLFFLQRVVVGSREQRGQEEMDGQTAGAELFIAGK